MTIIHRECLKDYEKIKDDKIIIQFISLFFFQRVRNTIIYYAHSDFYIFLFTKFTINFVHNVMIKQIYVLKPLIYQCYSRPTEGTHSSIFHMRRMTVCPFGRNDAQ